MSAALSSDTAIPLYDLPQPDVRRPARCAYQGGLQGPAIVIDNGSYACKAGWAGESDPRLVFKSVTCRPKDRGNGQQRSCVGEWGPGLKGWDFGKSTWRGIFDGDIPYQLEAQEQLFDWVFDRLSISGGSVDHPILLTHPPLGPPSNKAALAELLFEAYGVPAVQFAAPGPCAFYSSYKGGRVGSSGLVVASGHSSTYITAIHNGQPLWNYCTRSIICGALATQHLQQQLLLRYPQHAGALTLQAVEGMKEAHSYCAADYQQELQSMAADYDTAGGKAVAIQLPWVAPVVMSAEEVAAAAAAKAARAEENRQRLRQMTAARRQRTLEDKQDQLEQLLAIAEGLAEVEDDPDAQQQLLEQAGVRSAAELQRQIKETQEHLQRLRAAAAAAADPVEGIALEAAGAASSRLETPEVDPGPQLLSFTPEAAGADSTPGAAAAAGGVSMGERGPAATPPLEAGAGESVTDAAEFDLLGVPDEQLTPEQRKAKRRQQLLKAGRDARARAKAVKQQQELEKVAAAQAEDDALAADREGYIAALQQRHLAVAARMEARKRKELGVVDPTQAAAAALSGRGRRGGAQQRERLRLMAQAVQRTKKRRRARPAGGSESSSDEGFGANDADWDVYKQLQGGDSEDGEDGDDEAEYAWTLDRLRQVGAEVPMQSSAAGTPAPGFPTSAAAGGAGGELSRLGLSGSAAAAAAAAPGAAVGANVPPGHVLVGVGPEGYIYRPVTAEDYQVVLGVDRVRVPELLLQPSLAGVDQAGLAEIVMALLKQMPAQLRQQVVGGGLLLTGGNSAYPGLRERLQAELASWLPLGRPMQVVASQDPICEAWRGAALLAARPEVLTAAAGAVRRREYEEAGIDYLLEHCRGCWPSGVGAAVGP